MRDRRRAYATIALCALACVQGCYAYVPAPLATPKVGERVRLALTPAGATEMTRFLGPNVAVAEGDLVSTSDEALKVGVDFVQLYNGVRQPWSGEGVVTFPRAFVSSTQARVFQRQRSVVALSALGVALITIAIVALRASGVGGGNGNPPPPPPA